MTKEGFKNKEVLRLKYFYDLFAKRKELFPISFFYFPIKTRKKSMQVSWPLYKKITTTYLDIYFREFYFNNFPKYFFFSGNLIKTKGSIMINRGAIEPSILWIWYNRPSFAYFANVKLNKMGGSTCRVVKLDKEYKLNKDVSLLKGINDFLGIKGAKKFYKHD